MTSNATFYNDTHMKANYALPGNPNETLDRAGALWYLVDSCLNVEEYEWAGCSVRIKPKLEALRDIKEVAKLISVKTNLEMINEAYDTLLENQL